MSTKTNYYELIASEFEWKLSSQKSISAWGFNNSLPGPVIRAVKGDTVVVKIKNTLPEPTIIHWHGIRLPAAMDGTDSVQRPIMPGEEYEYRFEVPDAGTFWYHSHFNETEQMERGMYGALIVDGDGLSADDEKIFMIDDMKLNPDHSFRKGNFVSRWKERHDGREGDTLLINGKEDSLLTMHAGQTERWRFINSSSARYFLLHLEGKEFRVVSTDGGLVPERVVTELLITPGERFDLLVGPFNEGDRFRIESLPYNRMTFLKPKRQSFARVEVKAARPTGIRIPEIPTAEPLAPGDAIPSRKIKFSVGPSLRHGIDFLVNGKTHAHDEPVLLGQLQVWEVSNTSLMDHPFHLHGFFFQVIEENGKAPAGIYWKDTYNLKPRSTIKIAWMPERTGSWMYHCHILEHHAAGMMGHFEIVEDLQAGRHGMHHGSVSVHNHESFGHKRSMHYGYPVQ